MELHSSAPFSDDDARAVARDFAYLQQHVDGRALAYLDSAATAQRPAAVLDAERSFSELHNAAVHRGASSAVGAATLAFEDARETVARFVGAEPSSIIWTANATDALNMVALGMADANAGLGDPAADIFRLGPGDEILVTEAEHHANLIPWQRLAQRTGAQLRWIPVRSDGTWTIDDARAAISASTKVVAFAHVSNVTGLLAPVEELTALAHEHGALVVLDACQSVPHLPVDFAALGVDFAAFSAHKMLGPNGLGVLYGRPELLAALPPARTGGSTITTVTMKRAEFLPAPQRFEAGTQAVSQTVALAEAVRYLEQHGMERIAVREHELLGRLLDGIAGISGVRVLGPSERAARVALVSVDVEGVHAHDVGQILDEHGVLVRVGHHCAQPLHRALGISASVRASVHLYTSNDDIDRFVAGLQETQRYFGVSA
ncbi:aminotransferase class V-fold PLP-dependent enzyme [Humidisolicoccus flavus]|uniref:aminotransferase class V-fold PLP-dependent enzyme n=1 Tax=Humidisolicoccus flavus TaxID=3111414 RepID=UPI00325616AE